MYRNLNGVLILAHGSKRKETDRIMNSLTEKVKAKISEKLIVPAYLQFSEQNLEKGIKQLIEKGATKIKIIPMFLFDGVHVTKDIPQEIGDINKKYPGVQIKMSECIGDDDRIADIIVDRMNSIE